MKDPNKINNEETLNSLENLSDEELVFLKNQAIVDEDYDKAKEIKQEQERREKEIKEKAKREVGSTRTKEETNKKKEALTSVLLDDEKYKEFMHMMEGVVRHIKGSNEGVVNSNIQLGTNIQELGERLGSLISKMSSFIEDYSMSNYRLSQRMESLENSIEGLIQKVGENNELYYRR